MRPLALDLFCGAGGASKGLVDAGFDVIGVDIDCIEETSDALFIAAARSDVPLLVAEVRRLRAWEAVADQFLRYHECRSDGMPDERLDRELDLALALYRAVSGGT